ncbi:MAG: methionine synthase [candidate division WS1 bacterium]|jgi:5-methyltetrahydrofolate--homocysteine methyltransferase|nr:methionine synthase [candidate division WS1 bacterium]
MNRFKQLLSDRRVIIADGAWGTQLSERGLQPGEAPESWVLIQPDAVREVANAYVCAGAEIVLTDTFGGSRFKLAKVGFADDAEQINRRAAELSKDAAGDSALVFASVGPTGEFMQPLGLVSEEEMVEVFAEQIAALQAGGADGILIETMTDLGEAKAALQAAKNVFSGPVVVSMTFDKGPKGYATMMGVRPEQAAEELQGAGADVVGSNCGHGIENMVEVIRLMDGATDLPLWAKPNAGLPQLVGGKTIFTQTPEETAAHFGELVEAGARIIGGCCGTTPEHIRALVQAREQLDA